MNKIFLLSIICLFVLDLRSAVGQTARDIGEQMFESIAKINTLTYEMKKTERINGKIREQRAFIKLCRDPFSVYIRQIEPNEGLEVLYRHGEETALVNPSGFPWFNIRLEPLGSRMIKDQHHTIFNSGFDYFGSILKFLFNKYQSDLDKMATITSKTNGNNKDCWVLKFDNPDFKYIDYTVQQGETVVSIAEKFKLNAYMIIGLNAEIDHYNDIRTGQVIKMPNDYSPKMTLYIDKQTGTPDMVQVYDEKGLYEQYEFRKVDINPAFHPDEFTASFPEYDF